MLIHVGTHWIVLPEYFQMSTHMSGFQSFFRFFASFFVGQISHQQHKGLKGFPDIRSGKIFERELKVEHFFLRYFQIIRAALTEGDQLMSSPPF